MDYFLTNYFLTVFLVIGFALKLYRHKATMDTQLKYFWLTAICTLILVAADTLEYETSQFEDLRTLRVFYSTIGYIFRPIAALTIAMVVTPDCNDRRQWVLWMPCVVNMIIFLTAFFSPLAFYFDEDYAFHRGPLGYSVFVVSVFYIVVALVQVHRHYSTEDRGMQRIVLYICAIACLGTAMIDVFYGGARLNTAVIISSVFLYMFLRSFDTGRDPLTRLPNILTFYDDCARFSTSITAVASADMNGLKDLNDKYGHQAGDKALAIAGSLLQKICNKNTYAYRIGGDEFVVLFIKQEEETIKGILASLEKDMDYARIHMAIGYSMRESDYVPVQEVIRQSDERMYAEKAAYYQENGIDRRKNPAQAK